MHKTYKNIQTLTFIAMMLINFSIVAQSFEGIIQWNIKMTLGSVDSKQQLPEISPEQMAELQEALKNPQVREMMEKNPQMKAQMDMIQQMKSGKNSIPDFFPKSISIQVKDKSSISSFDGGMFAGKEILNDGKSGKVYSISRNNKSYSVLPSSGETSTQKFKVTKTNTTEKIAGYTATKYLVETTEDGKKVLSEVFATTQIAGIDKKVFKALQMGKNNEWPNEIEGFPVRIVSKQAEGTFTMDLVSVNQKSLPASAFEIPSGFTETKGSGF